MQHNTFDYILKYNTKRNIKLFDEVDSNKINYANTLISIVKFLTKFGIYFIPFAIVWLYIAALVHQAHSLWP